MSNPTKLQQRLDTLDHLVRNASEDDLRETVNILAEMGARSSVIAHVTDRLPSDETPRSSFGA